MKRLFTILTIIGSIALSCNGSKHQDQQSIIDQNDARPAYQIPDTKQMGLFGTVKQMSVVSFFCKTENSKLLINGFRDSIHYSFDKNGFLLNKTFYTETQIQIDSFKYGNGKLLYCISYLELPSLHQIIKTDSTAFTWTDGKKFSEIRYSYTKPGMIQNNRSDYELNDAGRLKTKAYDFKENDSSVTHVEDVYIYSNDTTIMNRTIPHGTLFTIHEYPLLKDKLGNITKNVRKLSDENDLLTLVLTSYIYY